MKYLDTLYQIGFECQVATARPDLSPYSPLYQIGFECQVATDGFELFGVFILYQIGFECQVATKTFGFIFSLHYIKLVLNVKLQQLI